MSEVFFSSDIHFGHANIIEYANRPYGSVEEMDAALIENWNSVVQQHDEVYFTGDFAMRAKAERVREILLQLNGKIFVIAGNHDDILKKMWVRDDLKGTPIQWIRDYQELKVDGQRIVLFHFPIEEWHQAHRGAWHLHGHQHGNGAIPTTPRMDIGVDTHPEYRPYSFDEIAEIMKDREWKPLSHH